MAQLKVIVNKLNRRKSPVTDFADKSNVVDVLHEGHVFESVGEITNIVGKWYLDRDGFYSWERGLGEPPGIKTPNAYFSINPNLINWNVRIPQIPAEWRMAKGSGIKVAVLDTGIFQLHEDLKNRIIYYQDFTSVDDKIDYDGHGTHVGGIIGAGSSSINGLIGVAPDCELIILKVLSDEKDINNAENYNIISEALAVAAEKGADVINMSFSLRTIKENPTIEFTESINNLKRKIKAIAENKIIMIAAAGDKADLKTGDLFFPAIEEEVISVAAITAGHFERNPIVHPNLNIVTPFTNYFSSFKEPIYYEKLWGCSMSCAFISGIVALAISANTNSPSQRFSKSAILSMLKNNNLQLDEINYNDNNNFYYHLLNSPV